MGGCCYNCLKYMVMIFNLIYMLLGLALLGTTLWIYFDEATLAPVTQDIQEYNYVIFFLMAVGAVMTVMGFLGCCGALQESQCMLSTFFALVLVLFAGQVAAGVWLYQNQAQFEKIVEDSVAKSIQHDYGYNKIKTEAFDITQRELQCCGSTGPSDWANARYNHPDNYPEIGIGDINVNTLTYKVPASCCIPDNGVDVCENSRQISGSPAIPVIYSEGCARKMISLIKQHDWIILCVVMFVVVIEILAMVFSMVLCCAVRRIDQFKA